MHSLADQSVRGAASYAEACARHSWKIPGFYNMAWDICDRHADGSGRTALIWETGDGSGRLSFDELKRRSDALAAALVRLGVAPGARAALMLPQTVEHALAHLAIFKCNAISLPLSRLFGPDALRYRLTDSEATGLARPLVRAPPA
jgi:acetyl-CoA synthetase